MNKYRYIEKDILCQYDLSEEFFNKLPFEVEDIIPLRKVFILITNEGKKILKLTDSNEDRIEFINSALKYISRDFNNVLSYYENKDGKIIYISNNKKYIILDMVDGREATFTNPVEVEICSRAIAKMHKASKGIFNNLPIDTIKGNLGEYLPYYFNNSKDELERIKENVLKFKFKNEFDNMFLTSVDKKIDDIKKAIELISMCDYNDLLEDIDKRVLCHNDLAHHNFIIDGNDVKIIDFDYCKIDTRVIDIANFATKVIKNNYYDINKFKLIINSYTSIEKLNRKEIKLIYSIIRFPKDFVTIVKDYYYKQKSWEYEVFLNRFIDKINNDKYRNEFIEKFIEEMKEYFY